MEILASLILLIGLILIIRKNQNKEQKNISLKELVKKTFPKYKIIEKNQTIMICEINHRNENDELVFIRIKPNQRKTIKKSGRMLIIDYPNKPGINELKTDLSKHLT